MQYFYAMIWFLVGILLIFRMGKENRIFYFLGAFFLFLGAWWTAGAAAHMNLFVGGWGWVLRGATAAVLAVTCIVFYRQIKKDRKSFHDSENRK